MRRSATSACPRTRTRRASPDAPFGRLKGGGGGNWELIGFTPNTTALIDNGVIVPRKMNVSGFFIVIFGFKALQDVCFTCVANVTRCSLINLCENFA